PFRESGHLLLMRVREAQGNVVEALRVHERLRTLLRDELGVAPRPEGQAASGRLRKPEQPQQAAPAPTPAPPPRPAEPVREDDGQFFATRSGGRFVGRRAELGALTQLFRAAA